MVFKVRQDQAVLPDMLRKMLFASMKAQATTVFPSGNGYADGYQLELLYRRPSHTQAIICQK